VAEDKEDETPTSVGAWAKRFSFAIRAAMELVLRPHGLGTTQWYVLHQLANEGPTMQRDLARMLHVERATLSRVVAVLVRKGLVDQTPSAEDQRQRVLRMTPAGATLWEKLPDLVAVIRDIAFEGADPAEMAAAVRVLQTATRQLDDHLAEAGGRASLGDAPAASAP
jgi:MarR family transcriptional regulator, lower aerobic nicotinate degradation pathway regulator